MLQEPGDEGVLDRDELVDARLRAQLQRPEQSADEAHSNLCGAIRLRVVLRRLLFADILHLLALHSNDLEGSDHQRLQ